MGVEADERKQRKKERKTETDTEPHRTTLHLQHSHITNLDVFIIIFCSYSTQLAVSRIIM